MTLRRAAAWDVLAACSSPPSPSSGATTSGETVSDTTIHIAPTVDVQRLADALNAAQLIGIKFKIGPNPNIHQDSVTGRYVPTVDALLDEDFPTTWEGGHSLVIEYGDCEFYGRCQCGKDFGMQTPNRPLDDFGTKWERHVMTEVGR